MLGQAPTNDCAAKGYLCAARSKGQKKQYGIRPGRLELLLGVLKREG